MSENRDTQFAGFAKLLFDDVEPMFSNRFIELDNGEKQEAEKSKQSILECFAESAYDLVQHAIVSQNPIAQQSMDDDDIVASIPDMTAWPDEGKKG